MHTLWLLMGFPSGSVLTNLLASLIWTPLAYLWARVHIRRLHARHDTHEQALADLHAKVDAIRDERQHTPIGSLADGTPVHIDGERLYQEVQRQTLRYKRRNGSGGVGG